MKLFEVLGVGAVSLALVAGGTTAAVAAPVPLSPSVVDTDVPTRIRVGAAEMDIPVTVITTVENMDHVEVELVNPRGTTGFDPYGTSSGPEPARSRVHKLTVGLYADELVAWGPHQWLIGVSATPASQPSADAAVMADVRAHSLLGLATSRSGGTVAVRGSLRAFNTLESRYAAWSGQAVSVQRWTGSAWVQVTGVRTDSRGNFTTRVAVPAGVDLRLVVKDAPAIWGAVSTTATV